MTKKYYIPIFLVVVISSLACSKKEKAPLEDGTFFEYNFRMTGISMQKMNIIYTFNQIDPAHYTVSVQTVDSTGNISKGNNEDPVIDEYMKDKEGEDFEAGMLGIMWLPSANRKIGAKFGEGKIIEETIWKDYPVFKLKVSLPGAKIEMYYHTETGFLVGSKVDHMGAGMDSELIDSNLDALFN